jgi:hypothetical protein
VAELPYRLQVGDTSSKESLQRAKTWIRRCSEEHQLCLQSSPSPLPKRVVEIDGTAIKLIETDNMHGRYIALSHCWGDSRPDCTTTLSTLVRNKSEIPWQSLPNTFRDAIEVTRQLGVRYLWIDSLCIIQDDENDWMQESSKMASVYQNAHLTICATVGQNDDAGLWPRVVPKLIEEVSLGHTGEQQYKLYFRDVDDTWESHMNVVRAHRTGRARCPLITRGWTLQERILSPRLLHYGHGELLWQCHESTTCECCFHDSERSLYMPHSDKSLYMPHSEDVTKAFRDMLSSGKSDDDVARNWRVLVEHYSNLSLTDPKDVLPAISALATVCSTVRPGDTYLAGLWENSIIDDMCWYANPRFHNRRPNQWRAPTYSWASVDGSVKWKESSETKTFKVYARLIRSSTILAGSDPMGQVLSGSVVLKGPVLETKALLWLEFCHVKANLGVGRDWIGCYADSITDFKKSLVDNVTSVLCLRLRALFNQSSSQSSTKESILVLSRIEGKCDVYQRVGLMPSLPTENVDIWFSEGSYEREIEIQ